MVHLRQFFFFQFLTPHDTILTFNDLDTIPTFNNLDKEAFENCVGKGVLLW